MTVFVLAPLVGFLVCAAAHAAVSRARPALVRHHGVLVGVLAGLAAVVLLAVVFVVRAPLPESAGERSGAAIVWVLAYFSLAYFYAFGVFNPGESARRVRLLIDLRARGRAGMTLDEILAAYNARIIVEARLRRMLVAGEVLERDGCYVIGRSVMLSVAKALVVLKRLYYGAPTEFERAPYAGTESDRA